MAAVTSLSSGILISRNRPSISSFDGQKKQILHLSWFVQRRNRTATSSSKAAVSPPVRASSSPPPDPRGKSCESDLDKAVLVSEDDLRYLVKVGGGSVAGAAAIKYGSILFPAIAQPNLTQALLMITAPVLAAVALLIAGSRRR
ncbi:uncharacterized protein LOC127246666 [Andrographis paniculata]|uniref:uncharacterized protein LOC127246666 n=1 Tax=Andrographis paniculata TaxID=175694 RepID=UPI0021E843D8|nr:uncharacterized protein LOC127246666 [Andrographis paniculata]XP_051124126.1 uncharacterized protein LOC127246666 [Andrographis paniculata]